MARGNRKRKNNGLILVAAAAVGAALLFGQNKTAPYAVSGGGLIAEIPVGGGLDFGGFSYPDITYPSITNNYGFPGIVPNETEQSSTNNVVAPQPLPFTTRPIKDDSDSTNLLDQATDLTKFLGAGNVGIGIVKELIVEQGYEPAYEGTKEYIKAFPADSSTAASAAGAISSGSLPAGIVYETAAIATSKTASGLIKGVAGVAIYPLAGYEILQYAGSHQAYSEQLTKTQSPYDAGNLAANTASIPITVAALVIGAPTGPADILIAGALGGAFNILAYGVGFGTQLAKNAIDPNVSLFGRSEAQLNRSESAVPRMNAPPAAPVHSVQTDTPASGTIYRPRNRHYSAADAARVYYGATPRSGFTGVLF